MAEMKARSGRIRTRIRPLAAQPVAPEYLGRREPRKRRLTAVFGAPRSMKMGTYMRLRQSRGFLRELRFLASQEGLCLHSWHDGPLAWPCFCGQAPTPAGLRLLAQGLDRESTRRAIMVWTMSGARAQRTS